MKIIRVLDNPSTSINFNCIEKVSFFSEKYPFVIFKDSRCIGYINCVTNEVIKLYDCAFKLAGNNYSMHLQTLDNGHVDCFTLIYNP